MGLQRFMFWGALISSAGACLQILVIGFMPLLVPLALVAVGLWLATVIVYALMPEPVTDDAAPLHEKERIARRRRVLLAWLLPVLALLLFELTLHGGHGDGAALVYLHISVFDAETASPVKDARITSHVEWREWDPTRNLIFATNEQGQAVVPVMMGAALYGGWMWRATTYSLLGHSVRVEHDQYGRLDVRLGDQSLTQWRWFGWPRQISLEVRTVMEKSNATANASGE